MEITENFQDFFYTIAVFITDPFTLNNFLTINTTTAKIFHLSCFWDKKYKELYQVVNIPDNPKDRFGVYATFILAYRFVNNYKHESIILYLNCRQTVKLLCEDYLRFVDIPKNINAKSKFKIKNNNYFSIFVNIYTKNKSKITIKPTRDKFILYLAHTIYYNKNSKFLLKVISKKYLVNLYELQKIIS